VNAPSSLSTLSLPLSRLLSHTADAVQAVRSGQSLNDALSRCPPEARPGTQALSFRVLRGLGGALAVRAQLAPKPPAAPIDALLLSALALLWPSGDAPYADHTLVDQAVTAARQRNAPSASFVNAVLRRFLRERTALVAAAEQDPAAAFNHPAWWIKRLRRDWPNQWQDILQANNQRGPMTLRVNARHGTAEAYVARLREIGMASEVVGPQGVMLAAPCPVTQLPGFADGDVSVQDAAAQMAAALLIGAGLPPGAKVLDACAAPGGKTAHLLELADLNVTALDSDANRLLRVDDTLARLKLSAKVTVGDAGDPQRWWNAVPFDAILLDAPCSASGIVRRHPDVRWLRRPEDIAALAAIQTRLLDALWPLLKVGGRLLYCSCSVFKAEGQDQIDAFLQRQVDASVVNSPASPGHLLPVPDNESRADGAGLLRSHDSHDGFFYALLQKS
jgi:16S rRNA (cytosine967-C5)-methyltransferase